MAAKLAPTREPVPLCEVASRVRGADAHHRRDSLSPPLVVVQVRPKRLLHLEPLHIRLEPRPALNAHLARELELHLRQLHLPPRRPPRPHPLLRLLAQLLQIELKRHSWLPSVAPAARPIRLERRLGLRLLKHRGWARPFPADWKRPSPQHTV